MRSRRWKYAFFALVGFAAILPLPLPAALQEPERPKLVVLVVFDQMRGDYLRKWQPLFIDGGFKRLQSEGAWFTNCHYPYAYTLTAPGHTSLVTGTTPSKHGIIANDWYDRVSQTSISSVTPPAESVRQGKGPYRRRAQTVGDALLDILMGRSRVFSFSIKDRAAILMAALKANACYWFEPKQGQLVTSPFYRDEPHKWIRDLNKRNMPEQYLGKSWEKFRPNLDYAKFSGPDDFFAEGIGYNQGQTFPHPWVVGKGKDAKEKYYEALDTSPAGSEMLVTIVETAIREEKIGQTDNVDLLCLSFSSNDLIGHCWGPDSQEVLDITLRSDVIIKNLLDLLDAKVGKGNYVFAMSADHGVCPLPEFAKLQGKDAGRLAPELLTTQVEAFLNKTFLKEGEKAPWLLLPKKANPWIYLNQPTLKELKLEPERVERALADWLTGQPGVEKAFTRSEMMAGKAPASGAALFESVRRSFHADGSGDVMVILKPYHLFSPPLLSKNPEKIEAYRTTHGTPHPYDTHVPLLVMGRGVKAGERDDRIAPQAMASILARALRIMAPRDAEYPVPEGLFEK
jgi:hypothetical protein